MKALTTQEMREVDRLTTERYGVPSLVLMENAGAAVAQFIRNRFPNLARTRIIVLCGKGNNGGDGVVVARHLREMEACPIVYSFGDPDAIEGDAAINFKRWKDVSNDLRPLRSSSELRLAASELAAADIIVDALLGTGVRGAVEGLLGEVIEEVNRRRVGQQVISVDIPSGLPADSGAVSDAVVRANHTVTFTAPKIGMLLGQASQCTGHLVVREIGSPPELIEEVGKGRFRWSEPREFLRFAIPRDPDGHKGDYGHVMIVAGSVGKSGAGVLASWAALRVGAGLVTVATPEPVLPLIAAHTPEVMTEPLLATETGSIALGSLENQKFDVLLQGKRTLAIGPGLSTHKETQEFVRRVVRNRSVPIILDADGLNAFGGRAIELRDLAGMLVVTPHPGEMARLLGSSIHDVQSRRLENAQSAAADWNCSVILKGRETVIASPDGCAWVNSTGNPGMGTGGTGDVLTGMLAGLTAQYGVASWPAVLSFGVYLHGLAGDLAYAESGAAPILASDLIRSIPRAYQHFYSECSRG